MCAHDFFMDEETNEAIPPKVYPETRYSGELLACGDCRHELEEKKPMFCPYCGKRIRW